MIFLYLAATFFTNITMLNMLIAIMGDTFDQVTENKQLNSTRTKLKFLNDYADMLITRPSEQQIKEGYLFVVQAEADEEETGEEWRGSINKIVD